MGVVKDVSIWIGNRGSLPPDQLEGEFPPDRGVITKLEVKRPWMIIEYEELGADEDEDVLAQD